MLISEKVKNLALIREAETEFGAGLNIITGETGAGKSLVIGSVELALGGKASPQAVRRGEDEATVELVFEASSDNEIEEMNALGIDMEEDNLVIMTRKIKEGRSTARINGNAVNASVLKKAAGALIDIQGRLFLRRLHEPVGGGKGIHHNQKLRIFRSRDGYLKLHIG